MVQDLLTISEVSRRSGVAASALRFYEDRGLIQSERAGSGHRRFARAVLRRIAFIVFAQKIGLSLDEIAREVARLPGNRVPVRADWARLSGSWTARIDRRIAELERLPLVADPGASGAGACRSRSARCRTLAIGPGGLGQVRATGLTRTITPEEEPHDDICTAPLCQERGRCHRLLSRCIRCG